jgi:hypothetical protein
MKENTKKTKRRWIDVIKMDLSEDEMEWAGLV